MIQAAGAGALIRLSRRLKTTSPAASLSVRSRRFVLIAVQKRKIALSLAEIAGSVINVCVGAGVLDGPLIEFDACKDVVRCFLL